MHQRRHHIVHDIVGLCTLEDDGNRWLVRNMIPRIGRTFAWGHGGSFKTSILFDLAIAVASGGQLLRHFPVEEHGPVFVVSAEGSKYTNRDRIMAHLRARELNSPELLARGGKPPIPTVEQVPLYYCQQAYILDDPMDAAEFREDIERIRPKLIILDPLDSFIEGDENSAKDTKGFRRYLDGVVEEFECSVVVVHHSTKDNKDRATSIRGSSAWRGWIDSSLFFERKTYPVGNKQVPYLQLVCKKQRDGTEGDIFTVMPEFDKQRGITTYTIMPANVDADLLMRSEAQQRVLGLLAQYGALLQKEIIDLSEYSYNKVVTALADLQFDGYIAQNALVERSTSADGGRKRNCPAWQLTGKISAVDATAAILKAQEAEEEEIQEKHEVFGFSTVSDERAEQAKRAEDGHDAEHDPVCPPAVSSGPPVPQLH